METETKSAEPRYASITDVIREQNERIAKLYGENQVLRDENADLRRSIDSKVKPEICEKAAMFDVLESYVKEDVDAREIGLAVTAYVDLVRMKRRTGYHE